MTDIEKSHERVMEARKIIHDYLKHLATLSTGSILLIVTFLEKMSAQPRWTWLVAVTIISLAICVMTTLIGQAGNLDSLTEHEDPNELGKITFIFMLISWFCFGVGIIAMVVFGVANLFQPTIT